MKNTIKSLKTKGECLSQYDIQELEKEIEKEIKRCKLEEERARKRGFTIRVASWMERRRAFEEVLKNE